ncbi:MFS transporter [Streptomyces sp. NPDC020742]|uniref:MFS transporter n=1 Tax=Streptomyces sp. NPDC020742 TaxID=3154897 RepID=UPI0034043371
MTHTASNDTSNAPNSLDSRRSSPACGGTDPAPPRAHQRSYEVPALLLGLLATPAALSANSATTTLPDIGEDLGVPVSSATWIATTFGLLMAVCTPLMAALLKRRGVRAVVLACAALVAAGTLLVVVAGSLPPLILGRGAQAIGGSGLVTTAITLAGTPRRMGVVTAGSGILGSLGPLAGSLLTEFVSWHAALSLSALALLATPGVIRTAPALPEEDPRTPFDVVGAVVVMALVSALVFIPRFPLPALVGAAVMAAVLVVHVRTRPDGFVPAAVWRTPVFLSASVVVCALSTSYFSLLYLVPRFLKDSAGWDAGLVGAGTLVALLTGSAASWLLAAFSTRMSRAAVLTVLLALGALAPVTATVTPFAALMLVASGVSVFVSSSGQATLSVYAADSVPYGQRPTAVGLFTLSYQLGGAFGPALATLLPT